MADIMDKLNNKRKILSEHEIWPDMKQINVRMCPSPIREAGKTRPGCNPNLGSKADGDPIDDDENATTAMVDGNHMKTGTGTNAALEEKGSRGIETSIIPGTAERTGATAASNNNLKRVNGRKAPRQGPCAFGCTTTTNIKKGVQVWRNPAMPSPWPGVGSRCLFVQRLLLQRHDTAEEWYRRGLKRQ